MTASLYRLTRDGLIAFALPAELWHDVERRDAQLQTARRLLPTLGRRHGCRDLLVFNAEGC